MKNDKCRTELPTVAILIVTRNRQDLLLRVLSQLQHLEYPKEKLGVFVVDGASTDGTSEMVRKRFPQANVISTEERVQIAACENIGIREILKAEIKYKYTWMLDDDVEIVPQTLRPLVEESEKDPNIGIIGSAVYDPEERGRLITAGMRIIWEKPRLSYNIPALDESENLLDVEIVPACSSLARTELYTASGIGPWDERFWLYWPDNDWCVRTLRNGYRVCCHRKSKIWHKRWTKEDNFLTPAMCHGTIRGALLFYCRHNPMNSSRIIRKYILKCYTKTAFERFTCRPNYARACEGAIQEFLRGDTSMEDCSSWMDISGLSGLDELCQQLPEKLPEYPDIILNQISDEDQKTKIKKTVSMYFEQIKWEEIPFDEKAQNLDPRKPLKDYMFYYLPRMVLRLLMFHKRADLIISPVSNPYLYNLTAAKYTMLIDNSLHGYVVKNEILKAFVGFITTILRGAKSIWIDLPRAKRNCRAFAESIKAFSSTRRPEPPRHKHHLGRVR